jgi:hypothetical protein
MIPVVTNDTDDENDKRNGTDNPCPSFEQSANGPKIKQHQTYGDSGYEANYDFLHSFLPLASSICGCAIIASYTPFVTSAWVLVGATVNLWIFIFRHYGLVPFLPLHKGKVLTLLLAFACYQTVEQGQPIGEIDFIRLLLSGNASSAAYWVAVLSILGSLQAMLGLIALTRRSVARFRPDLLKEAE